MSIPKTGFLTMLLGLSALLLASCDPLKPKVKATANGTDPAPVASGDPTDPGLTDPTLPAVPTGKSEDPSDTKIGFDPIKGKTPKVPNVTFEDPTPPKIGDPGEAPEHVQQPLPTPKAGMMPPEVKPQLVTLTWVGGKGKQWIQEVGFTSDGKIFAKSGGGGFTVYYAGDGSKRLEIAGDVNKASTGPRGINLNAKFPYKASCPSSTVKLEIGTETYSRTQAEPYLNSTAGWNWWGWKPADLPKGLDGATRGINVHYLHEDRFLAKVHTEGKTAMVKDPRDLKMDNPALITALLRDPAGPGTFYMAGNLKNGAPGVGTFVKGKALTEAVDPWERLYVGLPWAGTNVADTFKMGGIGGVCVLNQNLTTCLFSSTLGADAIYCMAIKDNMLVIGGSIGQEYVLDPKVPPKNLHPQKLPVKNPAQELPGGEEDGFLAIIKLW